MDRISDFWSARAHEHGLSPSASWDDHNAIRLELRELSRRLTDGDRVLDVGCANGFSTVALAQARRVSIRGVDISAAMIERAQRRLAAETNLIVGSVEFAVDDVTKLAEPDLRYDVCVAVRVIINLPDWETQQRALSECLRVLRPGGRLLLSDASLQGWRNLNGFRREWGLDPIPMPTFNRYIDEDLVVDAVAEQARLVERVDFSSTYYVGTRVLKPILAALVTGAPPAADPNLHWNRWFADLPSVGDYGVQRLFVFERC